VVATEVMSVEAMAVEAVAEVIVVVKATVVVVDENINVNNFIEIPECDFAMIL
jgi:hypothetical protein